MQKFIQLKDYKELNRFQDALEKNGLIKIISKVFYENKNAELSKAAINLAENFLLKNEKVFEAI
jgi:hypothetical protein